MPTVLYFHGFASSPSSAKIVALRPILARDGIELRTPDLNVPSFERLDWEAVIRLAVSEARSIAPRAIVGSSLGALLALEVVHRGILAPLVLIAPALGVARRWRERMPPGDPISVFNHARGENALIHRAFFDQITQVVVDLQPPPVPVTVIMGRKDETVPFAVVEETWKSWEAAGLMPGSKFIELAEGDHALTAEAELIAGEIRGVILSRPFGPKAG
ncbi:MAG: YqiA/YcfP family alpha/beta fold hydrolase [Thermoanaerobaculia bacterium]